MEVKDRLSFKRLKLSLFAILLIPILLAVSGCSSGGGGSAAGFMPSSSGQTGQFIDSEVEGLAYQTGSLSGTTDASGQFEYRQGETVTFSIGGITLGSASGQSIITPVQLVSGAADPSHQAVVNMCVFLQTLDEDGDLNNGIKINAQTAAVVQANAAGINFNQSAAAFAADPIVTGLITALNNNNAAGFTSQEAGGRRLRSATEAQAHLTATLAPRYPVTTAFGVVSGYAYNDSVWAWKGVPYARPPVGALRWKAPLDPDPWTGTRHATAACSECTQQIYDQYWRSANAFMGSENCLYLDIYRPRTTETGLPVFVYIHGGSNNFGSAKQYQGAALAARGNCIVVFVQYRLAAMGFLTHPALRTSGTAADISGNYGTLDHLKALAWVQNNITAFGGDPDKVVIGGQSAGGHNVMNLVVSPLGADLFRGAVVLSAGMTPLTVTAADTMTNTTIKGLLIRDGLATDNASATTYLAGMSNEDIENYLRGKTAEQILRARRDGVGADGSGSMPSHSAIRDGSVIRDNTWTGAIAAGTYNKVPVFIGTTEYEFKDFMALYGVPVKAASGGTVPSSAYTWYDLFRVIGVGGTPLALTDVLPTQTDRDFYQTIATLYTRRWKLTGVDLIARGLKTDDSDNPVYAFQFNWKGGGDPARADFATLFGAAHAMELAFYFGNAQDSWNYSFTAANQSGRIALQHAMMDYLASFIKTLDPNEAGSSLTYWPQWSNTGGDVKFITFDANLSNYIINYSTYEETLASVTADIATAKTTYGVPGVFTMFGM